MTRRGQFLAIAMLACAMLVPRALADDPPKGKVDKAVDYVFGKAKDFIVGASYDPDKGTAQVLGQTVIVKSFAKAAMTQKGDLHAGIGDVYQMEIKLEYQRRRDMGTMIVGQGNDTWEYWYEIYVDGEKALQEKIKTTQSEVNTTPGEMVTAERSIYLLAAKSSASTCTGVSSAKVSVRAVLKKFNEKLLLELAKDPPNWPRQKGDKWSDFKDYPYGKSESIHVEVGPGETYTPTGEAAGAGNPPAGKHWVWVHVHRWEVFAESWSPGKGEPPEDATRTVTIHNPWTLDLDHYPRDDFNHQDQASKGSFDFHLASRRDFPHANIGNPPKEVVVNSAVGASTHYVFGARDPRNGDRKALSEDGKVHYTQPFAFEPGVGDHPTRPVTLGFSGKVSGRRQVIEGKGPFVEWVATPRISGISTPGGSQCSPYSWTAMDHGREAAGTGYAEVSPAGEGELDSCLVGSWRSTSVDVMGAKYGGAGIVVTFKGDGTESIDYDEMEPMGAEREKNFWRGKTSGRISTKDGKAKLVRVDESGIVHTLKLPDGTTSKNPISGLGPAALGDSEPGAYTCKGDTLVYKNLAHTFNFERVKE